MNVATMNNVSPVQWVAAGFTPGSGDRFDVKTDRPVRFSIYKDVEDAQVEIVIESHIRYSMTYQGASSFQDAMNDAGTKYLQYQAKVTQ
jgi:hypothetical protein